MVVSWKNHHVVFTRVGFLFCAHCNSCD
ncbi:unnamed protein product [Spirodela intermedia]|uniref:Uncharacterized protein n=1 Tax=Spirodela intermedia TaxID=51605 RepID=A0A7I8JVG0_SPIIN|nr:unnamed protein product [Spirodela intermedia]CAA6673751.1 unnamed protein product [Spirodela intermedia]